MRYQSWPTGCHPPFCGSRHRLPGTSLLFDLMVTSIPVPSIPYTLDGAALAEIFPIAPLVAGQALVIGLSWYQGRAYVALNADRDGLPDVQHLAEAIQPAATALGSLKE